MLNNPFPFLGLSSAEAKNRQKDLVLQSKQQSESEKDKAIPPPDKMILLNTLAQWDKAFQAKHGEGG